MNAVQQAIADALAASSNGTNTSTVRSVSTDSLKTTSKSGLVA
jgi:hypothetical protein